MEQIIEIDLTNKHNLTGKYNEKKVSHGLIEYIIKQAEETNLYTDTKIIINKKCHIEEDCIKLIKEGLQEEYNRSLKKRDDNNIKQLVFLGLGILFIYLSTLIKNGDVWKEIILITGWVPIWKMIEVEILPDVAGRRKRKIIKKLLNSEFIEK
jgi:hypothetical protein